MTWRVHADADYEISVELPKLVDPKWGPINHWFENDQSVFSGEGPAPVSPHIQEFACLCNEMPIFQGSCTTCGGCGVARFWQTSTERLSEEAAEGLRLILCELEHF